MPIDDDLRAALRAGRVAAGRSMVVMSPADYALLEASVPVTDHPSPVTQFFDGITIQIMPGHPEGTITIVALPEPIRFAPSTLDALWSPPPPLAVPRWTHAGSGRDGGGGRDGIVIIEEHSTPPTPKSLWELLDVDEE
jgi:hypothetical protein